MMVFSADGEKLGKVTGSDVRGFFVEKGLFFPEEHYARWEHVASVSGDEVRLSRTKLDLEQPTGTAAPIRADEGDAAGRDLRRDRDEARMTRAEEELEVVKRERDAGEVRLRKDVVTETKHVEVPVTREEIRVERTPIDAPRTAGAGEARFQDESISMPVKEEEVEIRKRPVVKEEVRLARDREQHEQRASADVRREEIEVEDATGRRDPDLRGGPGGLGAPGKDDLDR
jgi:uncharacterized protein (TIGR02271 family)